jgi:hypothetical protein
MWSDRKKILIKHLKIGDMVVGRHVYEPHIYQQIVAGKIIGKTNTEDGGVAYQVEGNTLQRFGEPITFSGILKDTEVEVIDQGLCNIIIELYNLVNKQVIAGVSWQETSQKIIEIRHKSWQELEAKYPAEA